MFTFVFVDSPFPFNHSPIVSNGFLKTISLQHVIHILDDFFIAEPSKVLCLESFSTLLWVFMSLNAPVVASKTIGPSQVLEFVGVVVDSVHIEACLPDDKLT